MSHWSQKNLTMLRTSMPYLLQITNSIQNIFSYFSQKTTRNNHIPCPPFKRQNYEAIILWTLEFDKKNIEKWNYHHWS